MLTGLLRSALVALAAARLPRVRGAERARAAGLRGLTGALLLGRPLGDALAALDGGRLAPGDVRVLAALRRWPTSCLVRSLAGYAALRAAGEEVRFVIGVRPAGGDLVAHAWLERGGAPVDGPGDPRTTYAVAFTHPRAPALALDLEAPSVNAATPPRDPGQPRPSPDVLLTELADGTGVLLHLGTKFYYALNRTGLAVWKRLAAGEAATPDALAPAIAAEFAGAAPDQVRADVAALLRELLDEGLLLPGDAAGAPRGG